MKVMRLLAGALLFATSMLCVAQQRYAGGDISLLPEYVNAGAKYYDHDGKPVAKFLPWCKAEGMNLMRVRLFVNPEKYKQLHQNDNTDYKYDPNACQDLEYITPLCKDIADAGLDLMLDFHYSDTWADPAKQWTPIDWEKLTDAQLYDKIYEYTKESLTKLKDAGVTPAFIQPGNEISYGMLWGKLGSANLKKTFMGSDANWPRFGKLLNRAIEACREVCPDAKIALHLCEGHDNRAWLQDEKFGGQYFETFIHLVVLAFAALDNDDTLVADKWSVKDNNNVPGSYILCQGHSGKGISVLLEMGKYMERKRSGVLQYENGAIFLDFDNRAISCKFFDKAFSCHDFEIATIDKPNYFIQLDMVERCFADGLQPNDIDGYEVQVKALEWMFQQKRE